MAFVDFKLIKTYATITQVAEWLGLALIHNRCQCPLNKGDKRELVVTPDKGLFNCFGCKVGGDIIELVSHINGVSQRQAALDIQTKFHGYEPDVRGLPEGGLTYLQADHPQVLAWGITVEKAEEIGIGYAPRGTMIKHVLIPIRDGSGKLRGYLGIPPDTKVKVPKEFT